MKKFRLSAFTFITTAALALAGAGLGLTQAVASEGEVGPQACRYCAGCGARGGWGDGGFCLCCQEQ